MKDQRPLQEIARYFRNSEKTEKDLKIGVEFEHFVLNQKTLEAVTYYQEDGIQDTLKRLQEKGWQGKMVNGYLLSMEKDGATITLEPGAQVELSTGCHESLADIEKEYISFLEDIIPILEEKGQMLTAIGYHPQSKIADIPFIPKERYTHMSDYFKTKGKLAHCMMKGTASIHVAVDYTSEWDYKRKFRVANCLSPVFAALFDNCPFFEGDVWEKHGVRTRIWNDCDVVRCGVVPGALDVEFGYEEYANYILNIPPIILPRGSSMEYIRDTLYKEVFDPDHYTIEELEHVMTMVFPDVRTKKYMEIRVADSVPYPMNISVAALYKALLYDEKNLQALVEEYEDIRGIDVIIAKDQVIEQGIHGKLKSQSFYDIGRKLVGMAKEALDDDEKKYLEPLEALLERRKSPAELTRECLHLGKNEAVQWCDVNRVFKDLPKRNNING